MNGLNWKQKCRLLLTPVLMILLGVCLLLRPDSASAFVGKVLGWALIAVGAAYGVFAVRIRDFIVFRAIPALVCIGVGIWLLGSPLVLASVLGRIAGILIALQGIQDILHAIEWKCSMTWAIVATAVGALLIFVPMTASRLVMGVCGVVLIAMGGLVAYGRIKSDYLVVTASTLDEGTIDV